MTQYIVKIRMDAISPWGYYQHETRWDSTTKEKATIFKSKKEARKIRDRMKGFRMGIQSIVEELK